MSPFLLIQLKQELYIITDFRFMNIARYHLTLTLLLLVVGTAYSRKMPEVSHGLRGDSIIVNSEDSSKVIRCYKRNTDIEIHFKFDKYKLELGYMGNAASLKDFSHKIDSIGLAYIDSVVIISQSSPEGVYEHNLRLSENRARTMRKYLLEHHPELSDRLYVHPDGESWSRLREYVKKDTLMKNSTIEKVLAIIDSDVNIGTKKWRMEQLPVYRYLLKTYYTRIRNSTFCILYYSDIKPEPEPVKEEPVDTVPAPVPEPEPEPVPEPEPEVPGWIPQLHLKTNLIGLGMGIINAALEIDLAEHWSFSFPVYYSSWNYFKSTIKFRTFAVQPELRYWPSEDNDGLYVGAHYGYAYYNFAFDGDYRYQDHSQETPAIGAGLSIGYRMPLTKNQRWKMEFALGAGVHSLHYDKFYNTPDTKDGLLVKSIKETYWGVDQAEITFSYSLDLQKKGGKR